jgi:hypothetical protein
MIAYLLVEESSLLHFKEGAIDPDQVALTLSLQFRSCRNNGATMPYSTNDDLPLSLKRLRSGGRL